MRAVAGSLVVTAVVVALAAPAVAQPQAQKAPTGDVAVSYGILRNGISDGVTLPTGWVIAIAGRVHPRIAIVGEIGGNYKTDTLFDTSVSVNIHSFQGGIRYRPFERRTYEPFGQLLAGVVHAGGSPSSPAALLTAAEVFVVPTRAFSLQPGAGLDIRISPRISGRAQVDYRSIRAYGMNASELRFAFGAAFEF